MKKFIFIVAFLLLCRLSLLAIDTGTPAPLFQGITTAGETIKLEDLKGKIVLLDFWATWCGPCKKSFPFMVDLYNNYKQKGFEIVAVNLDNQPNLIDKFVKGLGVTPQFIIIKDSSTSIPPKYNLETMPVSFLIDKKGIIRYKHKGFDSGTKDDVTKELNLLLKEEQD